MADPIPTFTHVIKELARQFPDLAYLHVTEAYGQNTTDSIDFARKIWQPRPFISAGGYNSKSAIAAADATDAAIGFGRWFISNVCLFSSPVGLYG